MNEEIFAVVLLMGCSFFLGWLFREMTIKEKKVKGDLMNIKTSKRKLTPEQEAIKKARGSYRDD